MNKRGIELQLSFIVMLILAIVVFGFGLIFVKNLFSQADQIKAQLSEDAENRIELLLERGERVAFPITTGTVKSGDVATYGLGILNVRTETTTFFTTITCTLALDSRDDPIANGCDGTWTFPLDSVTLTKNEKAIIPIAIQAIGSKQRGTYGFTVKVAIDSPDGEIYGGSPKQIYLNIE